MVSRVKDLPERLKTERLALIRERHKKLVLEAKRAVESTLGDDHWEEEFDVN